jgi:hypothetical protein
VPAYTAVIGSSAGLWPSSTESSSPGTLRRSLVAIVWHTVVGVAFDGQPQRPSHRAPSPPRDFGGEASVFLFNVSVRQACSSRASLEGAGMTRLCFGPRCSRRVKIDQAVLRLPLRFRSPFILPTSIRTHGRSVEDASPSTAGAIDRTDMRRIRGWHPVVTCCRIDGRMPFGCRGQKGRWSSWTRVSNHAKPRFPTTKNCLIELKEKVL